MPLAIVDCGTNIRRVTCERAGIAASFRPAVRTAARSITTRRRSTTNAAASVVTSSARRPRAAIRTATAMEASAASTAMGTAAATTAVTAAVLSE
jgi:hypothetical protein